MNRNEFWNMLFHNRIQSLMFGADIDQLIGHISDALKAHPPDSVEGLRAVTRATWEPAYERGSAAGHEATSVRFQNQAIGVRFLLTQNGADDRDVRAFLTALVDAAITVERSGPQNEPNPPTPRAHSAAATGYKELGRIEAAAVAGWVHGHREGVQDANLSTGLAIYKALTDQVGEELIDRTRVPVRSSQGLHSVPARDWLAHHIALAVQGQDLIGEALRAPAEQQSRPASAVTSAFPRMPAVGPTAPSGLSQPAVPAAPATLGRTR